MTDDTIATVADALDTRPDALKPFVREEITAAEILGRFGGAPAHLDLVETGLGGDAHAGGEGADAGSRGDDRADPPGSAEGEAHDEPGPVTESNSNGGDDDRRDTSAGGYKGSETPDGGGAADAGDAAGTGTPDDRTGYRPTCGAWSTAAFDDPESDTHPPPTDYLRRVARGFKSTQRETRTNVGSQLRTEAETSSGACYQALTPTSCLLLLFRPG
jgi:hypothetical protein